MKFSDWLNVREGQEPSAPRKMSKCNHTKKKSSGVRCANDDLSADCKGHIAKNGEEEPFKEKGKGGSPVAPVA